MSKLMPKDIKNEVMDVLLDASQGKNSYHGFLTAYQILNKLPKPTREKLISDWKKGGKGIGTYFAATGVVAKAP